jgi:hypothetical protein
MAENRGKLFLKDLKAWEAASVAVTKQIYSQLQSLRCRHIQKRETWEM